jgi:hypothetical protein
MVCLASCFVIRCSGSGTDWLLLQTTPCVPPKRVRARNKRDIYRYEDGTSLFDMTDSHTVRVEGDSSIAVDMKAIPTRARVVAHRYQFTKRHFNSSSDSDDDDDGEYDCEDYDDEASAFVFRRHLADDTQQQDQHNAQTHQRPVSSKEITFPSSIDEQVLLATSNLELLQSLHQTDELRVEILSMLLLLKPALEQGLCDDNVLSNEPLCARLLEVVSAIASL